MYRTGHRSISTRCLKAKRDSCVLPPPPPQLPKHRSLQDLQPFVLTGCHTGVQGPGRPADRELLFGGKKGEGCFKFCCLAQCSSHGQHETSSWIFTGSSIDITPINIDIQNLHLMEVFKAVINKLFFFFPLLKGQTGAEGAAEFVCSVDGSRRNLDTKEIAKLFISCPIFSLRGERSIKAFICVHFSNDLVWPLIFA